MFLCFFSGFGFFCVFFGFWEFISWFVKEMFHQTKAKSFQTPGVLGVSRSWAEESKPPAPESSLPVLSLVSKPKAPVVGGSR